MDDHQLFGDIDKALLKLRFSQQEDDRVEARLRFNTLMEKADTGGAFKRYPEVFDFIREITDEM